MSKIIVVGAGPVGLSAALWLNKKQFDVDVMDKKSGPTELSKAVGINPRTLELFEDTGLTQQLIAHGNKMYGINFRHQNKILFNLDFTKLHHRYNFMLALPQCITESLLINALDEVGVNINWNHEFVECHADSGALKVIVEKEGLRGIQHYDFCLGADGAHSQVRKDQGFTFAGKAYPDDWHLVDLEMDCPYSNHEANVLLHDDGAILFVAPLGKNRFRLVANTKCAFDYLPIDCQIEKITWQSNFHVHCRQVASYQNGPVFLAGDAAHVHSPAGGRGMNLGIEDAHEFADLLAKGKTADYTARRIDVGRKVLADTDRIFRIAAMKNPMLRYMRDHFLFNILSQHSIQQQVLTRMAGVGDA